ncbi:MAG: LapA family protein [Eubacteriales bacterium]|nr:LapA family protein [Eubacteriales bacterium]MDD4390484.1 LapA family protein [Eubacteriales bacterium]
MNIRFIGILASLLVVGIFAVQNSAATSIRFLFYEINISKAIVIIAAVVIGCIIGLMVSVLKTLKKNKEVKSATKEYNNSQMKLRELEEDNRRLEASNAKIKEEIEEVKRKASEAAAQAMSAVEVAKATPTEAPAGSSETRGDAIAEADQKDSSKSKWSKFFDM